MHNYADLLLKNGIVVLPEGTHKADILVVDGKIADIGFFAASCAKETIDCNGLHILPGVIDTQVHFREPGATHKETLESGMMAAAAGGVTAIFEMPNTSPLTTTPDTLKQKLDIAAKNPWVDYAFYLGGTAENAKNLAKWERLFGVCGIKIFMGSSTGDLLVASDEEVESVLANGRRVVAVHSEDENMMIENKKNILKNSNDPAMHPVWRSVESCLSSTKRLVNIARKLGRRVHVLHVTSEEEMEFLSQHKDIVTIEVLANHLTLCAPECYKTLGTKAQQNPAIREKKHQDALWRAIGNGMVDIIGSDHAPHTLDEKSKQYPQSPSGTPGVQTLVSIMLDHVNKGKLSLERFVDLVSYGPLRVHGIVGKGRIVRGYEANFTIVDLKTKRTITNAQQKSRAGWTPFDGLIVQGWPVMTIIRGAVIMREDQLFQKVGKPVQFFETLKVS